MINVGIDVGKRFCQAVLKTEDGKLLDELRLENTSQGIDQLLKHITAHGREARALMESTGNCWIRVHDILEEHGVDALLINLLNTKLIAEAEIKSGKSDARTLASLLQGNLVFESYVPLKLQREHRIPVRHRAGLVKARTEIRKRIDALLSFI